MQSHIYSISCSDHRKCNMFPSNLLYVNYSTRFPFYFAGKLLRIVLVILPSERFLSWETKESQFCNWIFSLSSFFFSGKKDESLFVFLFIISQGPCSSIGFVIMSYSWFWFSSRKLREFHSNLKAHKQKETQHRILCMSKLFSIHFFNLCFEPFSLSVLNFSVLILKQKWSLLRCCQRVVNLIRFKSLGRRF